MYNCPVSSYHSLFAFFHFLRILLQESLHVHSCYAAFTGCHDGLTVVRVADVAGSEDAPLLETKLGLSRRLYSKPVKKLEDI